MVGGMIRRSVRRSFRGVYWIPPSSPLPQPSILSPNHHGWHDGYLMYHVIRALDLQCLDWITEFDAFPLFSKVGGMPFPADDPHRRAATVRTTIRRMIAERVNLVMFAEGDLHYPPDLLPMGKALKSVAKAVPGCSIVPVAIKYEMALHERPEAFILIGSPLEPSDDIQVRTRDALQALLAEAAFRIRQRPDEWVELVRGKRDVNERWDMRRAPKIGPKGP